MQYLLAKVKALVNTAKKIALNFKKFNQQLQAASHLENIGSFRKTDGKHAREGNAICALTFQLIRTQIYGKRLMKDFSKKLSDCKSV